MNSSVTFMEKLRKTFDNHSTGQPTIHMINKNTYKNKFLGLGVFSSRQ